MSAAPGSATAYAALRSAVAFLTPFSLPPVSLVGRAGDEDTNLATASVGSRAPDAASLTWFPVVGAGIGWGVAAAWLIARRTLGPLAAACVGVLGDVAATGALHLDGLADSADGLLAHASEKDRLAIMAEPDIGAFGALALTTAVVARTAALAELEPSSSLLAATWCASRSLMALACRKLPYARPGGLASGLVVREASPSPGARPEAAAAAGLLAAAVLAGASHGGRGVAALCGGLAAGCGVLALARRRLGGFTGDVLGAAGVVTETVALLLASRATSREDLG